MNRRSTLGMLPEILSWDKGMFCRAHVTCYLDNGHVARHATCHVQPPREGWRRHVIPLQPLTYYALHIQHPQFQFVIYIENIIEIEKYDRKSRLIEKLKLG